MPARQGPRGNTSELPSYAVKPKYRQLVSFMGNGNWFVTKISVGRDEVAAISIKISAVGVDDDFYS